MHWLISKNNSVFLFLKIDVVLAKSADPDETPPSLKFTVTRLGVSVSHRVKNNIDPGWLLMKQSDQEQQPHEESV